MLLVGGKTYPSSPKNRKSPTVAGYNDYSQLEYRVQQLV